MNYAYKYIFKIIYRHYKGMVNATYTRKKMHAQNAHILLNVFVLIVSLFLIYIVYYKTNTFIFIYQTNKSIEKK